MSAIKVKDLTYVYSPGTSYERKALDGISLHINKGDVLGIVGGNGSGKSTLIKHFNGLLYPASGSITVLGRDTSVKQYRNELWKNVGMVFQFPEQQLFEENVFNEIAYGLKNMGVDVKEIPALVRAALAKVGLEGESIEKFSPVLLSGGLRRRVALASILAMNPEILIMDEPTAGLDACGRKSIMELIQNIKKDNNRTMIIVSHNISELLLVCTHIAVMEKGELISYGETDEVLKCKSIGSPNYSLLPEYLRLVHSMAKYKSGINTQISSFKEAEEEMYTFMRGLL